MTALLTLFIAFIAIGGDINRIGEQVSLLNKICSIDTKMNNKAVYYGSDSQSISDEIAKTYISLADDNYAAYFTPEEYKSYIKDKKGISDKSIGVSISIKQGEKYPTVVYVHKNSPANKTGIKAGDKLININGISLENKSTSEAAQLIKENDTAKLIVKRNSEKISFSVKLDEFTYDSVIARMIDDVCVIKITEFSEATVSQFDDAINYADKNNAKALIFDLRNNPGGYVNNCAEILDRICGQGDLVRVKDKRGEIKVIATSDKEEINMPMALIVNKNSASASEIFAMNFRDFKKGKIVGEKTFGKGIAQTTYELNDGSAVKFTTETVVNEKGKTYDKKGISPDIEVNFTEEQNANYLFLTDEEDTQLKKALEIVK